MVRAPHRICLVSRVPVTLEPSVDIISFCVGPISAQGHACVVGKRRTLAGGGDARPSRWYATSSCFAGGCSNTTQVASRCVPQCVALPPPSGYRPHRLLCSAFFDRQCEVSERVLGQSACFNLHQRPWECRAPGLSTTWRSNIATFASFPPCIGVRLRLRACRNVARRRNRHHWAASIASVLATRLVETPRPSFRNSMRLHSGGVPTTEHHCIALYYGYFLF